MMCLFCFTMGMALIMAHRVTYCTRVHVLTNEKGPTTHCSLQGGLCYCSPIASKIRVGCWLFAVGEHTELKALDPTSRREVQQHLTPTRKAHSNSAAENHEADEITPSICYLIFAWRGRRRRLHAWLVNRESHPWSKSPFQVRLLIASYFSGKGQPCLCPNSSDIRHIPGCCKAN